jgi:hypothetical protein
MALDLSLHDFSGIAFGKAEVKRGIDICVTIRVKHYMHPFSVFSREFLTLFGNRYKLVEK